MSRRALLAACLVAAPLRAQAPEDRSAAELRALIARADSQLAVYALERARQELASAPRRTARLMMSGDVALVHWDAVPSARARELARRADSVLTESGAVPAAFVRSVVLVMERAADTAAALSSPDVAGRRRLAFQVPVTQLTRTVDDWWVLGPLLTEYTAGLHSTWRDWGQNAFGFVRWKPSEAAERGGRELTAPRYAAGEQCLAGHAVGCRRYLGVDDDAHPYAARFTPAELRAMIAEYYGGYAGVTDCRSGDDAACVQVLERFPFAGIGGVPAGGDTRAGLLAAVSAMHGTDALHAALADTTGSIGERLAGASGVSLDSLVLEWRAWALSGGRPYHVRAGFGDLAAALVAVALLLILATRSGRWQ